MAIIPIESVGDVGVNYDSPAHILSPGAFSAGNNVKFNEGVMQKAPGQQVSSVLGTPSIAPHWGIPWKQTADTYWIYCGTAKAYYVAGGSQTEITRKIPSPAACVAALAGNGAGNLGNGVYKYKVTFVAGATETHAGDVSNSLTIADNSVDGQVGLTGIPTGIGVVTARKLYRTVVDGSAYLLLATLADNSTTTYTDNTVDGSLGAAIPMGNNTVYDYSTSTRPAWTGGILHGVPIVNHDNFADPPQAFNSTLARFADLPNWPVNTFAKTIRLFKNVVVALHLQEGGVELPYKLRWSDAATPGNVPTSWDETLGTNIAGSHTIAQSGGFLVDCAPLGDLNVIYKTDAIWGMQPIGGIEVFRFWEISGTVGLLAQGAIAEFYKQHFLVGIDDIVVFNGVQPTSVGRKIMRSWLFQNIDTSYFGKTIVYKNLSEKEMWICFVEAGATSQYLTKALIWNWEFNTWYVRDLPDIAHIDFGALSTSTDTFTGGATGSFDTAASTFGSSANSPTEQQTIMFKNYGGSLFLQAETNYDNNGSNYTSNIERIGLGFFGQDERGQVLVNANMRKLLRSIYIKAFASAPVTLQVYVGSHDEPNGAVSWVGPLAFVVGTDFKLDCVVNGKYLAYRITDDGATNIKWQVTGVAFDVDILGEL